MQTFLPYATTDFLKIAESLDNKRLNKQALEGWQILLTLTSLDPEGNNRTPKGWVNHPAVKMWRGSEAMLYTYILAMTYEWVSRGYKTTIGDKATSTLEVAEERGRVGRRQPVWMLSQDKYDAIASSHRKALLCKDYEWYSQFGWDEDEGVAPTSYEYIWD
jgi:hypothetical protein